MGDGILTYEAIIHVLFAHRSRVRGPIFEQLMLRSVPGGLICGLMLEPTSNKIAPVRKALGGPVA